MTDALAQFRGRFQLWGYTVSHGQLLLRSPKSDERPTQIDVLFKNVGFIQLPIALDGLEIHLSKPTRLGAARGILVGPSRQLYELIGRNAVGYVTAGTCVWNEGGHDYGERSPLVSEIGFSITGGGEGRPPN